MSMMVESLPVKEIKCSLEVVAVFTDHPPKIKLDNHFLGLIQYARTSLFLIVTLFIVSFTPTWYSPVVRHSFGG